MGDPDAIAKRFEVLSDGIRDEHRAMTTSRAADRDRYVGFSFLLVLRNEEIQESFETPEKLRSLRLFIHERDDRRIFAVEWLEMRHKVRIRQEPDVKDEI